MIYKFKILTKEQKQDVKRAFDLLIEKENDTKDYTEIFDLLCIGRKE